MAEGLFRFAKIMILHAFATNFDGFQLWSNSITLEFIHGYKYTYSELWNYKTWYTLKQSSMSSKLFYSSPTPCICGRKWSGWSCRAYKLPRDLDDSGSKPVFGYFDFWAPGVLMSVESFPLLLKFVVQSALYIWSNLKLSYCMQNSCRTCYLKILKS